MSYPPNYGYSGFLYSYPHTYYWIREYPQVKTDILNHSIQDYYKLMEEGYRILNKLSEHSFAVQVMTAAQAGNKQEVDRLMKTISSNATIQSEFSPSGIGITVDPKVQNTPCCKLAMFLKWG
ncbi:hypothetical protein P4H66_27195 [Paenibacillus dokdonensis]|uniref:Uncharacterized protein n=1 Tax=Paenibacillus dokdonensis TaxID=2567944 RepID=A0ABU6GVX9_9BACL|nr:hypothetical protein [Paenibacillus dokdonensis]MEC0243509.1 hypothetical protein [Paenibacillus dokdonensis]